MNSELLEFTRHALTAGASRDEVAKALKDAGWAEGDIAAALNAFAPIKFPVPVPKPKPYLSAREVFIYLVLFTALYMSAYNLGSLAFNFINRTFPDTLQNGVYVPNFNDTIRWNVASLAVAFPLFLYIFNLVNKAIAKDPTKRSSRARKWLTYLTLFVAAFSLTGDLTTLLYNVLGGELTIRFVLKVLTVAIIAGGAFTYFLMDLRKEEKA